jgi:hypothetical protein
MPTKNDVKFNNQAFINSYIDKIIEETNPSYTNVCTIDTSNKSFSEQIALLTGKTNLKLTSLKTHQYSSLVPKIRLYRVNNENNSEYEFIFNKDTKFNNINVLKDSFITGNNCGIRSMNWILAGTNPVSAEKTIEVKLELYFDSINSFSGGSYDQMIKFWNGDNPSLLDSPFDFPSSKTTNNYWSLIYHPRLQADRYDSPLFRIKAVVGWEQIDSRILAELFGDKAGINEELYDSDYVFYLNLVQHQFNFNEDGSLVLTANYIANFENSLSSTKFDLLRGLKEQINKLNNLSLATLDLINNKSTTVDNTYEASNSDQGFSLDANGLAAQAKDYLSYNESQKRIKFLSYLQNNKGDISKLREESIKCGAALEELFPSFNTNVVVDGNTTDLVNFDAKAVEQALQVYQTNQELLNEAISKATLLTKNLFYSKLIYKLLQEKGNGKWRMYTVVLNQDNAKQWLNWKNGVGDVKPDIVFEITGLNAGGQVQNQINNLSLESDPNSGELEWNEGEPDTFEEAQTQIRENEENLNSNKYKLIHFTTIGHLFDAAYSIVQEKLNSTTETNEFLKNKVIFSNFSSAIANSDGSKKMKSLASIPVEFNNLISFLNESLYQKGTTEYSLFSFIKDVTTKIAQPVLESREVPNEEVNKYSNVSISNTIISLGSDTITKDPLSNFYSNPASKLIDLSSKSLSDLKKFYLSRTNISKGNLIPFNYFIIYDKYHKDFSGVGNKINDEKKGIYHYTIAQDYGLVKAINFKKIDQPFLKESKSVGKKTVYLGQFRDIYNAEIKMIGNNIYYPGMMVFIKPSIEFGKVIGSPGNPSFSQITGVGGYFSVVKVTSDITQEFYTTTLDCVFHSNDGLQPEANAECNYDELEKAGLYSPDGTGISPVSSLVIETLKKSTVEIRKAEEEAKAEEARKQDEDLSRTKRLEPGKI